MVGSTLPSHCTSMGRVLLAAADEPGRAAWLAAAALDRRTERTLVDKPALGAELACVAEQRWSLVEEELELGLRSLAVPVRDRSGATVAALNVATFSAAHSAEYLIDRYRSEEQTYELQSLMRISYAVICLTKKTQQSQHNTNLRE